MKEWFLRFWKDHGDRIVFSGIATCFALAFWFFFNGQMDGEAKTILVGVAMLFFNKSRGVKEEKSNEEK